MRRPGLLSVLAWCATIALQVSPIGRAAPAVADPAPATAPVMIVLDASGSMTTADAPGPRIDAAKKATTDLITALPAGAQVGLTVYGTGTGSSDVEKAAGCKDIRQLVPVGTVDKTSFIAAVDSVTARGYTPIGPALQQAAAALPAGKPGSIVLVSDGLDTCSPPSPCDIAGQLKAGNVDLVVHTIGFRVNEEARQQLSCIARAAGGTYVDASDGARLGSILRSQVDAGLRPYEVAGTPVNGTPTPTAAPVISPGQYTDTFPAGGSVTKYYSIDLVKGQTVYVTTTLVPAALRGGGVGDKLAVVTRLESTRGSGCLPTERESDTLLAGKVDPVSALISGLVGGAKWSKSCADSGRFVVVVTRSNGSTIATRSETIVRIEPPLATPAADAMSLVPPGLPPPALGSPTGKVGGASFNTAPLIEAGTYSDTLSTGETRYYKVHLDWGQRLAYQIVVDKIGGLDHGVGFVNSAVATPNRQEIALSANSNAARDFGGPESISVAGSTLVPIAYGNRNSDRSDVRSYSLAGDYYLSLGMSYPVGAVPFQTTVTLALAVDGAPSAAPDYLPLPSASITAPSAAIGSGLSQATRTDSSSGSAALLWGSVIGGAVVIAAGTAFVVRRRRVTH